MNILIINGNLTNDCVIKHCRNEYGEYDVLSFSIANNEGYGDRKETTFVDCVYTRKSLTKLVPYLRKGTAVLLQGVPSLTKWTSRDGTVHSSLSMAVDVLNLVGGKPRQTSPLQGSLSGQQVENSAPVPSVNNPEEERLPY